MQGLIGFGVILLVASCIPAWVTHCATQIVRLIEGVGEPFWNAVVLVLGALFAPLGVIHGWLIWFGVA